MMHRLDDCSERLLHSQSKSLGYSRFIGSGGSNSPPITGLIIPGG